MVTNLESNDSVQFSHVVHCVAGVSGAVRVGDSPEGVAGVNRHDAVLALVGRGLVKCRISDPCEKECPESGGGKCC